MELVLIMAIIGGAIFISHLFRRIDPTRPVRAAIAALFISLVVVAAISYVVAGYDIGYTAIAFWIFGLWAVPASLIASALFWLASLKRGQACDPDA
jgi:hypothetical protein